MPSIKTLTFLAGVLLSVLPCESQEKSVSCDCGDVVFKLSENSVVITHSAAVRKRLSEVNVDRKDRAALRRIVQRADTIVQRHFNMDLYAHHDPTGWQKEHESLIAMPFGEWQKYREKQITHYKSWITVCPRLQLESVVMEASETSLRYRMTQVGVFLGLLEDKNGKFEYSQNRKTVSLDLVFNEEGVLVGTYWEPAGWEVEDLKHTRAGLVAKLSRNPYFQESKKELEGEKIRWRERLIDLDKAALVCK